MAAYVTEKVESATASAAVKIMAERKAGEEKTDEMG
jgi:hypothetical protein